MSEAVVPDLATLTVQLLTAYLGNNPVPSSQLPELIRATKAALGGDEKPAAQVAQLETQPQPALQHVPAVSVEASLASRDHILSLIDGKPYKSLKRHLSSHGLTPAEYRARYSLPADYPMVAPNYSEQRRQVATRLGLGRKTAEAKAPQAEVAPASPPKRGARAKTTASAPAPTNRAGRKARTAKPKNARLAE
ncbi:MucR family transcriptional regulator [Xanthobacter autotrophicus]|uniref:MucR family transcriptional regulator n=1 Tax=Xanthobacter autotrophicus TaxID=280 RepID=UPI0037267EEB